MLVLDIHVYCFNFYEWKKEFQLRNHWQVYRKSICPVCERGRGQSLSFASTPTQLPLYAFNCSVFAGALKRDLLIKSLKTSVIVSSTGLN